jgi:DNA-binding NarL/FixJ family response regulator
MSAIKSDPARMKDRPLRAHPPPKMPFRILIADDHSIIRDAVTAILEREGFKVVAEVSNGREAVGRTIELHPDVAVLDLVMPVKNGIEAAQEIITVFPGTRIILLTARRGYYYVRQALGVGVQGYVVKSRFYEDLVQAIHDVCQGKCYLSPGLSTEIFQE